MHRLIVHGVVSFDQDITKENSVVLAGNYEGYDWCAYSNYDYATAMDVDDWWRISERLKQVRKSVFLIHFG